MHADFEIKGKKKVPKRFREKFPNTAITGNKL